MKNAVSVFMIATLILSVLTGCSPTENESNTVTDVDGNVYQTVQIGSQVWMAENLKVIHYRNGDAIPNITNGSSWSSITTGAYCNYDNNDTHVAIYGRLYNYYAVKDSRNIAPAGWHVPSDNEWQTLIDHLGGYSVAGGKMKETGTDHWTSPNTDATNESGFTALPGGLRGDVDGDYIKMGLYACFYSSTEYRSLEAISRKLTWYFPTAVSWHYGRRVGLSVRCVKD